jgi:hypothetical protein
VHTVKEKRECLAEKVAEITCMTCLSTHQQTTGPGPWSASSRLSDTEIVPSIVSSKHEASNVNPRDPVELRDIAAVDARVEKFGAFECSNTCASQLGMIASGGEFEDCPWIKALRSQSVLYSQFDGHQQSLIHLCRNKFIRQLKELLEFLHADLCSRGTTVHNEIDKVSGDLAGMVEFDWSSFERLVGGEGDEVSDECAEEDFSILSKEIVIVAYLSFLNCQASTLNPTLSFETRMISAFGLS